MNPVDLLVQKWWHRCCASFTTSLLMLHHSSPNELAAINKAHCKEPARLQQHPTATRALSPYTAIHCNTQAVQRGRVVAFLTGKGEKERLRMDGQWQRSSFRKEVAVPESPPAPGYRCSASDPGDGRKALGCRSHSAPLQSRMLNQREAFRSTLYTHLRSWQSTAQAADH